MKVALVYDRVNKWGGAERVLLALHKLFPQAPLYASVYNPKTASWADVFDVRSSFLEKLPFAPRSHEAYAFLMPIAFEQFNFDDFDLVISVTSEAAKGIITKPHTKHLCICLTPTRYLWSGYDMYFENRLLRFFTYPIVKYLRIWDLVAATRPDKYIAISSEVKKRIKKYYSSESEIIYPPLMIQVNSEKSLKDDDFFLIVSRLVSYKRIELAVRACNKLKVPLIIVGTGSEKSKLKKLAGPTISFRGSLTDEELVTYYRRCRALIFPGNEDFGLTMAEAQSFGKPVIAYKAGGALDIIKEGETGLFFESQTVDSLAHAIKKFSDISFSEGMIKKSAERFGYQNFETSLKREIQKFNWEKLRKEKF